MMGPKNNETNKTLARNEHDVKQEKSLAKHKVKDQTGKRLCYGSHALHRMKPRTYIEITISMQFTHDHSAKKRSKTRRKILLSLYRPATI